ncbi:hypothetical protein, partial [Sphingopyxis sp. KK2]|uniref:hypothetical protein n=1 Tax=Sphingopyxis sp. KK2 TaxID=1855727 RepID=UPI0011817BBA
MAGFFAFLAIVVLFIMLMDTRSRLKRAEATLKEAAKRIGALQRHAGLLPPKDDETPEQARAAAMAPLPGQSAAARPAASIPTATSSWATPSAETLDRWKPKAEEPETPPDEVA